MAPHKRAYRIVMAISASLAFVLAPRSALADDQRPLSFEAVREVVEAYLRFGLEPKYANWDPEGGDVEVEKKSPTRFSYALVDLNGDGKKEIAAYIEGGQWCGMSGCDAVILQQDDCGYRVLEVLAPARLPIRVAATQSSGWRDLVIHIAGGGEPPHDALFRYGGDAYETDWRSEPGAQRTDVLILDRPGRLLLRSGAKAQRPAFKFHRGGCRIS